MKVLLFVAVCHLCSCRSADRTDITTDSTITTQRSDETTIEAPATPEPRQDTTNTGGGSSSALPPPVEPLSPERLDDFLPKLDNMTAEEVQHETRIRSNLRLSRASQVFRSGDKKFTVTINDFAYMPANYAPYEQFRTGNYLQDDNLERTELTRVSGYETIQTWLKKENRAELTTFPGNRFVVTVVGDNLADVREARMVLEQTNLRELEAQQ